MEHLDLVKILPREVVNVEEFSLEVKDKKVKAAGLFKLDSVLAAWLYRIAVLLMLGWHVDILKTLSNKIADRVVAKMSVSKALDDPESAEPADIPQPSVKHKPIKPVPPAKKKDLRRPSPGAVDPPQGALIAPRQPPFPVMACSVLPKGDFK